jgi:Na+-driven multidrug efflux pump
VLGANVLQSLNGSVNAVSGRLIGADALAATANANLVLFLLLGAVFGIGLAATILVGQSMGAGDTLQARKVVGTAATFFLAVSLCSRLPDGFLRRRSCACSARRPKPCRWRSLSARAVLGRALPEPARLRDDGVARSRRFQTPFLFMGLAVGLDIVVNPLFITGIGPCGALGIAGTALAHAGRPGGRASLPSWSFSTVASTRCGTPDRTLMSASARSGHVEAVVAKGVPMGLQMIVISASALILMGLVNAYGARMAAAYGVAAQLWTYAQMPALAIGAAVTAMAAQNIGAGRWDRISRITAAGVGSTWLSPARWWRRSICSSPSCSACSWATTWRRGRSLSTSTRRWRGPSSCSASRSCCSARCGRRARSPRLW